MNTLSQHITPKPPDAPIRDGDHYLHLLSGAKWVILISGFLALLVSIAVVFLVVRPEKPELEARALIGLEKNQEFSNSKNTVAANLGREDIMMSRTFLKEVARKLSLQLWTMPFGRNEIFDSVSVDSAASSGTYIVRCSQQASSMFQIYYYDTTAFSLPVIGFLPQSAGVLVASGNWDSDSAVNLPGVTIVFNHAIRTRPHTVTFKVVDIRIAVEDVLKNLTVKRADPEKGINYISVTMTGRDYQLASATANAIADGFIDKNNSFSDSRTRGIVGSLDKQLKLAQNDLAYAESKLRDFRSGNPSVGLNQQALLTVTNLAQLDNGIQNMSTDLSEAKHLKDSFASTADSAQQLQLAQQMTGVLLAHSIPAGKILQDELGRLLLHRNDLNASYGSEHPLVLENNRAIKKAIQNIYRALDDFLGNTQTVLSKNAQVVQQLSHKLRQLPAQEMQLSELQRNMQIYTDIYSAVLNRYNQAKVANAVEASDFYIMDYAVAPLPPPADRTRFIIICVLLSLLVAFGPVLVVDLLDKTVRSPRQLARITGNVVLESIPTFFAVNDKGVAQKRGIHPLISGPCMPTFTKEIVDSLFVKINLRMPEAADKSIVVSSFEDGSGKSTMSANLAIDSAMQGHRTILIDADLRRGTVKDIFNLNMLAGLAGLLASSKPLTDEDCIKVIVETKVPNLFVVPSGQEPLNPGALLASPRMEEFKKFCQKHMGYIIVDTPPLGIVSDAVVIQDLFPHYIFVVQSGKTKVSELVNRINEFDRLPQKVLGFVLNRASQDAVGVYKRYSKYYTH